MVNYLYIRIENYWFNRAIVWFWNTCVGGVGADSTGCSLSEKFILASIFLQDCSHFLQTNVQKSGNQIFKFLLQKWILELEPFFNYLTYLGSYIRIAKNMLKFLFLIDIWDIKTKPYM